MRIKPVEGAAARASRWMLKTGGFLFGLCIAAGALPFAPGQSGGWQASGTHAGAVVDLHIHDDGSGPTLLAVGGNAAGVMRWDGLWWQPFGQRPFYGWSPRSLETFDSGSGPQLYSAAAPGGVRVWDDVNGWTLVGGGWNGPNNVFELEVHDDGSGPALYALGNFELGSGPNVIRTIARWDGSTWSAVGDPPFALTNPINGSLLATVNNRIGHSALKVLDDGHGPALYVLGARDQWYNIAWKWDGTTWINIVPQGFWGRSGGRELCDITIFDDGTGPALYICGRFLGVGGDELANNIARAPLRTESSEVGTPHLAWEAVGEGLPGAISWPLSIPPTVNVLFPFDDGTGPTLYAGRGTMAALSFGGPGFISPHMNSAVKKWDGSSWSPVINVSNYPSYPYYGPGPPTAVFDFEVFDHGGGVQLFMAGDFTILGGDQFGIGGFPATHLARRTWPATPTVHMTQPAGPGGAVYLQTANLTVGREFYTLFSFDLGPPGMSGPFGGLFAVTPLNTNFLLQQLFTPLGVAPTHFQAEVPYEIHGPFNFLPPFAVDAVIFDFTGGVLGSLSPPARFHVN